MFNLVIGNLRNIENARKHNRETGFQLRKVPEMTTIIFWFLVFFVSGFTWPSQKFY